MKNILMAAILSHTFWVDLPAGASNGNVPFIFGSCIAKAGTPTAQTKFGVTVYAPGKTTFGSECPPGTPLPPQE